MPSSRISSAAPWLAIGLAAVLACGRGAPPPRLPPPPAPPYQPVPPPVEAAPPAEPGSPVTPASPLPPASGPPARSEPSPVAPRRPPAPTAPAAIRVGLATDLEALDLPCCDPRRSLLLGGDTRLPLNSAVRVTPAPGAARSAVYRLQVAALKDEGQADQLAARLAASTSWPADAVFDAGSDLYRVRVGRFAERTAADAAKPRLAELGLADAWVASEGAVLDDPGFAVSWSGQRRRVGGRWLILEAPAELGVAYRGRRYRGRLLVFLNPRGQLNVINEVALEDYLRGVVPKEMGPELYHETEALKAQAVAARTWAVRNLGTFAAEGYDVCSTPRCQVYGGMAVEHPASDRILRETAGQVVLFQGELTETFYGATCGGHTENVETVFPEKRGAYLRGVPCVEAGVSRLAGGVTAGTPLAVALMRGLLPESGGERRRQLAARVEHLALLAGLAVPRDRPRSLNGREVVRFVTSVFDLALDRRLVAAEAADLARLAAAPPAEWGARERRLAAFLADGELLARPRQMASEAELEALLLELALYLGVVERVDARFLAVAGGELRVAASAPRNLAVPPGFATFRDGAGGGGGPRAASLALMAGDPLEVYRHRDRLLGVVQRGTPREVRFGQRGTKRRWRLYKSQSELRAAVQRRYPGFPFEGFEVLERGVSGRVGRLRLLGSGGRSQIVEGLAVRWTLDVWDTWFEARRTRPEGREPGWVFDGHGWGHGVGMCQAGAFGMAMRGASYRDILGHYYSGIEIGLLAARDGV